MISNYARLLEPDVRERYFQKIKDINVDPFNLIQEFNNNKGSKISWESIEKKSKTIPPVQEIDIYHYFVETVSYYTKQQLKCYKSLDAYNFFVSNHIKDVKWVFVKNHFIVIGKVLHSQSQTKDPVDLWILIKPEGEIRTAHCRCTAGSGEVCSHIGAVAYYLHHFNKLKNSTACTDVLCAWKEANGSTSKKLSPKKLTKVSYASVRSVKRCLQQQEKGEICQQPKKKITLEITFSQVYKPEQVLPKINVICSQAAILKGFKPYCLKPETHSFPKAICFIDAEPYKNLEIKQIIEKGKLLDFSLNEKQIREMEEDSRCQSESELWNVYRSGRLTASNMRAICHTKSFYSSTSLIERICYPLKSKVETAATVWGCDHERIAFEHYLSKNKHKNVQVEKCGLFIHPKLPFIAASPDGIVNCECCGLGVLEIKCPLCAKEKDIRSLAYLDTESESEELGLIQDHQYFFQVQTQLFCVTKANYADFVVWSPTQFHVERIYKNENVWNLIQKVGSDFFYNAVLPELLCQYFTKNESAKDEAEKSVKKYNPSFCICQTTKRGKVIYCCQQGCSIIKFHVSYVGLKNTRKTWVCTTCLKKHAYSKS